LQARDKQHESEAQLKIDTLRKDLQEKSDQQRAELHRQLADIDAARAQAIRNEEKTKQDADDALKAVREKHKIDMAEQKQRLKQDAENERMLLLKTHEQQRKEFEHRTTKAEDEMKRIRQSLKAQNEGVSTPSAIGQEDSTVIYKPLDRFRKPRRKVDRRTNTVSELPPTQAHALHDSQGSYKENIEPRNRTFSEPDSWPIGLEIYNDTSTSSLSEVQSMSLPSQREIQANNILSQIRVGSNKSSSSWGPSQPMPNPFIDSDRPASKSGAIANTSSPRSQNIANTLSILHPTLLDRDAFPIGNPGDSAHVQHQPISHSTVDEVPQLRPGDATNGLTPNTSRFFGPSSMVQSAEKKNISASPDFMAYDHPTANRPHSDSIRDETRKRKSLSAHHDGQISKKSRPPLTGMSRARSSQTNRRYSGRRTKSAKAVKNSMYLIAPICEAKADIAVGDRYADRFNEELTRPGC